MQIKLFILIQAFIAITATAQVNTDEIQLIIKASRTDVPLQYPEYIKEVYQTNNYNYLWINNSHSSQILLQLLQTSADLGLQEEDYQFDLIQSLRNNYLIRPTHQDSLMTEVRLTDAAIHFFRDDTPWKMLFSFNKRYFSHGCMRVEKAIELAHFLLKENTITIDTLEEKGCIRNQAPLPIPIAEHIPVFVLYNTAWIDSAGTVQFNEDVYRKIR